LKNIYNIITPHYGAHWRAIGKHLGMETGLLDIIDHDHHHRAEDCCNAVWEQWLDIDTTASWGKVMKVIESLEVVSVMHEAAVQSGNSAEGLVPVPVTKTRVQLQNFYIQERYTTSENDWPSYQPEHFTSVALIHHKEKHVTTREVIAIANVMHKGEVSVREENQKGSLHSYTSASKITTNIAEIFSRLTSHSGKADDVQLEAKVILIEGSPGIGKTILSKEIAFQWAKNKLLNEKMLLF